MRDEQATDSRRWLNRVVVVQGDVHLAFSIQLVEHDALQRVVRTGGIAKAHPEERWHVGLRYDGLLQPFSTRLSQTSTDGMTHQSLPLVLRLYLWLTGNDEESDGRCLFCVEVVGQAEIVPSGTLTAQHGHHLAAFQHDVVALALGRLKTVEHLQADAVVLDGLGQVVLTLLQGALSLWVHQ